jgi:hypothetical protein
MNESATMQNVFDRFLDHYQQHHRLSTAQHTVCRHIGLCRTEALGGQFVHCDQCEFNQLRYHSCRNRHCPKCQRQASVDWCEQQLQHVVPATYYHMVFTLPHSLNTWVQLHPETLYRCLFDSVWHTIKTFGRDPKRLDGQMGMTAALHTWGQTMSQHVHLHCLIPGGALSEDQQQWHPAKSNHLFPVKALSRHFRGTMVSALRRAWQDGQLGRLDAAQVKTQLDELMQCQWVVYSKSYLNKAETVVEYLSRYSHKIAISDHRIEAMNDSQVSFGYKDYRDGKRKSMQLPAEEFIRRFLLHVLPPGFMRIRHYGFLSNRTRVAKLDIIRALLNQTPVAGEQVQSTESPSTEDPQGSQGPELLDCLCPKCKQGRLRVRFEIAPKRQSSS